MDRNTLTTVYALKIGDRFYKKNDRAKEVWTKVEGKTKITKYQTYKHFGIRDLEPWSGPLPLNSNTEVVFLRNVNQAELEKQNESGLANKSL